MEANACHGTPQLVPRKSPRNLDTLKELACSVGRSCTALNKPASTTAPPQYISSLGLKRAASTNTHRIAAAPVDGNPARMASARLKPSTPVQRSEGRFESRTTLRQASGIHAAPSIAPKCCAWDVK